MRSSVPSPRASTSRRAFFGLQEGLNDRKRIYAWQTEKNKLMSLKMKNLLNIESELFNVTLWSSDRQLYFYKLLTLIFRIVVSENAWMLWPCAKSLGLLLSFLQSVKDKNSWKKLMLYRCFAFVTLKPVKEECHWKLANQTKQFISFFYRCGTLLRFANKGSKMLT